MANILIIDDEEYIRDILSARVEGLNHNAFSASTIREGTDLIEKEKFDLVFLDIQLPDGSGFNLLKIIQQLPSRPEVIIITATGSPTGVELARKAGAFDYLSKPLQKKDIILRINRALAHRETK